MTTFTGCTQGEVNAMLEYALEKNRSIASLAHAFTARQLAAFIDAFIPTIARKETAATDRAISKSLCCFLYVLSTEGASHYSDIRTIVFNDYDHQVNDYATLKYWGLIEKSLKSAGYWKISEKGQQFLLGKIAIPQILTIQKGKVIKTSSRQVTIADFDGFKHVGYNRPLSDDQTIDLISE